MDFFFFFFFLLSSPLSPFPLLTKPADPLPENEAIPAAGQRPGAVSSQHFLARRGWRPAPSPPGPSRAPAAPRPAGGGDLLAALPPLPAAGGGRRYELPPPRDPPSPGAAPAFRTPGGGLDKSTPSAKKAAARSLSPPPSRPVPAGCSGRCEGTGRRRGSGGGAAEAASGERTGSRARGTSAPRQGRHGRGGRKGRRALSPARKSHRRPSLFSQHFIGGCWVSISSFHPREKARHPLPRRKN